MIFAQLEKWRSLNDENKVELGFERQSQLIDDALSVDRLGDADKIYKELAKLFDRDMDVVILARRLAQYCGNENLIDRKNEYTEQAQRLLGRTEAKA